MGNSEETEWQSIATALDEIDSMTVDIASGPANGSLVLLAAKSGTIEDRRPQPPYFLIDFEGAEKVVVQTDSFYSIHGNPSGANGAVISASNDLTKLGALEGFPSQARAFVVSGSWHHVEIVARDFKVHRFDSELAARTFAIEGVMA